MIAALLIAGAAIAHTVWNIAMKRAGTSGTPFIAATLLVGVVIFAPIAVPALIATPPVAQGWPLLVLGSGLLQLAYFLMLQRGYRLADVGVVYPLARGTGPLLSVIGAILVLGERPEPVALIGAALVVAGVIVIGLAGARERSVLGVEGAARRGRGIRYGVAVGALIAAYTLWDAAAVTVAGLEPVGYYWASMVVQLIVLAPLSLRGRVTVSRIAWGSLPRKASRTEPEISARTGGNAGEHAEGHPAPHPAPHPIEVTLMAAVRQHPVAVIVVGVLSPLAYVAILMAYQLAPVSIVAPAREVSVVLIALASWVLLREPHPRQRVAGSVVVLVGIALLAAG